MSSMFRFSAASPKPETTAAAAPAAKPQEVHALDALTGGAFSASTSGDRAARIREWLGTNPTPEQMQDVFRELSGKDKGAAKPLREKLDEIKRAKGQEALAVEWAGRGQTLLEQSKLNIADALAWQRDAAKAGAPLSREPLAGIKTQLAERVKGIEDLQHRVQVQREAAVLLAQRIEVLSTKSWQDAHAATEALGADTQAWQQQAEALTTDVNWSSLDVRFPGLLEASKGQLLAVWTAFEAAVTQAVAASTDPQAPLPPVPVWAQELRPQREAAPAPEARAAAPKVDPEVRAAANQAVREVLARVEREVAEGHGKASAGAANALRQALKEHGKHIDHELEVQGQAALASAGELEGWQRWRADQLREELVIKAEGLLKRPDGQALGGRKMQETLRQMRDQWKQTDQGGAPNHALWKRFDEACNAAHAVVEAWLDKIRSEAAANRAQRLALIEEVKAWTASSASGAGGEAVDWKAVNRALHQFADRWRDAGHLGEKAYTEMQPLWKDAIHAAHAPIEAAQHASVERRRAMIEEAKALGAAPTLRIDAVKALQQRWQAEAHVVPLERKFEQKLWDAFRQPIDEAFNRKTTEREKAASAVNEHDRRVLEASKALQEANASGDAQQIRQAMTALDAALRGERPVAAAAPAAVQAPADGAPAPAAEVVANEAAEAPAEAAPAAPAVAPRKVVAVRGDDRPGMKKAEPAPVGRGGKFGDRKDARGPRDGQRTDGPRGGDRPARADREGWGGGRDRDAGFERAGPRLGDAAFRAQREALELAQQSLRKLAAQAHGEVLTHLLGAWEHRQPEQLPSAQDLGRAVPASARSAWAQALGAAPGADGAQALLRLEIAAEVPTPAEQLEARRALQLQLLTRRNDPTPAQTWAQDATQVLAGAFDAGRARRLQNALKVLLKR